MTTTDALDLDHNFDVDDLDLELTEVSTGPPARAVLAAGAASALLLLYALFGLVTGNLGMVQLLLLVVGLGGALFVYKQLSTAQTPELVELGNRLKSVGGRSSVPAPSVRVKNGLLDL